MRQSQKPAKKSGTKKKRDWEVALTKAWRSFPSTKKSASESRDFIIRSPFAVNHQHIPQPSIPHLATIWFSDFWRCILASLDVAIAQRAPLTDTASTLQFLSNPFQ
jgi:hypothetical protein